MASLGRMVEQSKNSGNRGVRGYRRTNPRSSASRSSDNLYLPGIIDAETVDTQQTGIQRRAGNQLNYAEGGSPGYTAEDIARLQAIKSDAPGWIPEWSYGPLTALGRVGQFLDRPAQVLRMSLFDAINIFDENVDENGNQLGFFDLGSLQFTLDDYWDVLAGNREELAADNPGLGIDDGDFSFKDMANAGISFGSQTRRWEQTDAWLNKWGRTGVLMLAEGLFDPLNALTGGLSGVGKKVAIEIADVGLRKAGVTTLQTMKKLGQEALTMPAGQLRISGREATKLERRMFSEIQKRLVELRVAKPTQVLDDAIEEAAGWQKTIRNLTDEGLEVIPIKDIVGKGTKIQDDWGVFSSVEKATAAEVADGLVGGTGKKLSWFAEIQTEVSRTITNKKFRSNNPFWTYWVDHASRLNGAKEGSQLLVTTGGITFGLPFGKAVARQVEIPGVTKATRGIAAAITRPVRDALGGQAIDDFTFKFSQQFNTSAFAMRLAKQSGEILPGQPIDIEIARFAQYQELQATSNLFDTLKPHIAGASIVQTSVDRIKKDIRKELKGLNITKRKGGKDAEQAVLDEINNAAFGNRTPDFSKVGFNMSPELVGKATAVVVKARAIRKPAERFVSKFVPELAEAIANGKPYTPLRMSNPGGELLTELANGIAGGNRNPPLISLVETMRKVNRSFGEPGGYTKALGDVVDSLEAKAKRTKIMLPYDIWNAGKC